MDWNSSSGSSSHENISPVCQQGQQAQIPHEDPTKGMVFMNIELLSAHLFRLVIDGLFSLLSPKLEEVTGVGVKLQSVSPVIPVGWSFKRGLVSSHGFFCMNE